MWERRGIYRVLLGKAERKRPLGRHRGRWEDNINTLRTGHLNCLNARSRGLNNLNQLLYCVSLKIYNKFANYFCELKVSGNTHKDPSFYKHPSAGPFGEMLHVLRN